jgi:hypothetical protein
MKNLSKFAIALSLTLSVSFISANSYAVDKVDVENAADDAQTNVEVKGLKAKGDVQDAVDARSTGDKMSDTAEITKKQVGNKLRKAGRSVKQAVSNE